jgi:hypothetical protein
MKIELSDEEWMSLIDGTREGGLAICCANVSALRDDIISAARNGGTVLIFNEELIKENMGWVDDSHDIGDIPALVKLRQQLGLEDKIPHTPSRHGEVH